MINNIEKLVDKIKKEIKKNIDIAVIGMSGGADSTLCAILCREALGKDKVFGVHMPYGDIDIKNFNAKSQMLAEYLEIKSINSPIHNIVDLLNDTIEESTWCSLITNKPLTIVNKGNSRSRSRMCILYGISHHLGTTLEKRVRVIGTGNLSEDFIGYCTKGGDVLGDFFPIADLFKSEVYQLLDYFKSWGIINEEHITRIPSAGLWKGQTDEEELGYSYDEMELAIRLIKTFNTYTIKDFDLLLDIFFTNGNTNREVVKFVYNMYMNNKHKHKISPYIKLRKFCN